METEPDFSKGQSCVALPAFPMDPKSLAPAKDVGHVPAFPMDPKSLAPAKDVGHVPVTSTAALVTVPGKDATERELAEISRTSVPPLTSNAERVKRYRQSAKGRDTRKRFEREYRQTEVGRERARKSREAEYLSRPFIAWDGEGVTADNRHRYVLLANSLGSCIVDPDGLPSVEIWECLLRAKEVNPKAINVIYGGGYDFNFFLRSLSRDDVLRVYEHRAKSRQSGVKVGKYRIWWRRGKYFRVARGSLSVTVYDLLPFFQRTFDTACVEYLGEDYEGRAEIVAQKKRRSEFGLDELDDIRHYNDLELRNLVRLATELRARLNKVGLRPGRWDGPGAIAAVLLAEKGIKHAKSERNQKKTPNGVASAIRCAYAGGRFEVVRFGDVQTSAYEYDVNSAYPHALRRVPCLAHGRWIHHDSDPGHVDFAIYHARYSGPQGWEPAPLFRRLDRGQIIYPGAVNGWYWTPEIDAAREYCQRTKDANLEIVDVWAWEPDTAGCAEAKHSPKPFDWINGYYLKRQALKAGGDGAHVGIKLALNSLYGKLAQQVGWYRDIGGKLCIPPFHELAWAGYVTSTCRSMVFRAGLENPRAIVAYETDAVFSTCPLPVDLGTGLGQWEETTFTSLAYCQSGTWFGTQADGKVIVKTRGVDRGTLSRTDFTDALQQGMATDRVMAAQLTRFIGAGLALAQDWDKWCTWQTEPKRITAEPPEGSKRYHYDCPECYTPKELAVAKRRGESLGYKLGVWHRTECHYDSFTEPRESCEFPIEWVNPNPAMILAELREGNYEAFDGME